MNPECIHNEVCELGRKGGRCRCEHFMTRFAWHRQAPGRKLMTEDETIEYLGSPVNARLLRTLRERRQIAFVRVGHRTIAYRRDDLDAFLERFRRPPAWEKPDRIRA